MHLLEAMEQLHLNHTAGGESQDIARIGRLHEQLIEHKTERSPSGKWRLTRTRGRRETGTHYTPSAVAECLVRFTLESLVYVSPVDEQPRELWKLLSATELLGLRICDPACGSGVLLVQACRYLADRVLEAWRNRPAHTTLARRAMRLPTNKGDQIRFARRLVAERCLFGVDKNPMATELAKLSLWLFVGDKETPIGFLDRNVRRGDSLLGVGPGEPRVLATEVRTSLPPVADVLGSPSTSLGAFHWPLEFPEVFAERSGFDAILANPPWGAKSHPRCSGGQAIHSTPLSILRRHF
jgi:hypothetical protein